MHRRTTSNRVPCGCNGNHLRRATFPGAPAPHPSAVCCHSFGLNGFKLHGLPLPRPGHLLGLLGANGTGKSTAFKVPPPPHFEV